MNKKYILSKLSVIVLLIAVFGVIIVLYSPDKEELAFGIGAILFSIISATGFVFSSLSQLAISIILSKERVNDRSSLFEMQNLRDTGLLLFLPSFFVTIFMITRLLN